MLKLFLLCNNTINDYDCYWGFVVAALDEAAARKLCNERPANEGSIWEDANKVSCEEIGIYTGETDGPWDSEARIILSDFHAG